MSGLVPRPCYSFQHLQNCCHETKSRDWVGKHMHSVVCSKCEPASQGEFLRSIYSFNHGAPQSLIQSSLLVAVCSKCQIWHCVGKECAMPLFANECFLQDLSALAAKLSKCWKFVSHKPACTRMQKDCRPHLLPTHQNYNWQCYLNRPTCSMWAYRPRIFTETMVWTI